MAVKREVVVQEWLGAWSNRVKSFSMHLTVEDCNAFVAKRKKRLPDIYPDECMRPVVGHFLTKVDSAVFSKIEETNEGLMCHSRFPRGFFSSFALRWLLR